MKRRHQRTALALLAAVGTVGGTLTLSPAPAAAGTAAKIAGTGKVVFKPPASEPAVEARIHLLRRLWRGLGTGRVRLREGCLRRRQGHGETG